MEATWRTSDGSVQLYLGDCLEVLPTLEAVGAVVTDFPYCVARVGFADFSLKLYPPDIETVSTALRIIDVNNCHAPVVSFASPDFRYPGRWTSVARWYDGGHQMAGHSWHEILSCRCRITGAFVDKNETEHHRYQKPESLVVKLVEAASCREQLVVDPFMGSGTTGVACVRLGRRFIGVEKELKYFEIAVKRIEAELNRAPLFEEPPQVQRNLLEER